MEVLLALILKASESAKKIIAFLSKEFLLIFIYGVVGAALTAIVWVLLTYVFPNKEIYPYLVTELQGSEKITLLFLYAACIGCIYLFRLLLAAVQANFLK